MGLVEEKEIFLRISGILEIPAEPHVFVEDVVVVADDQNAGFRKIETELVGTDPVLLRFPDQSVGRVDRIVGSEQFRQGADLAFAVGDEGRAEIVRHPVHPLAGPAVHAE